jgi:hypothetical protein
MCALMSHKFGSHASGAMRVSACQRFMVCVTAAGISGRWDWSVMDVGLESLQLSWRSYVGWLVVWTCWEGRLAADTAGIEITVIG